MDGQKEQELSYCKHIVHEALRRLCDRRASCYVHIFRHDLLRYISCELDVFLHVLHVYDYWEASDHYMMHMFALAFIW